MPTIADDNILNLKYKPAKLIKYELYLPTTLHESFYNKRYCFYSLNEISDGVIDVEIKLSKDSKSCIGTGWSFPQYIEKKFIINENGEILSESKNEAIIKLFRFISIPLPSKYDNTTFIPLPFPKESVKLGEELTFDEKKEINKKVYNFERKILFKRLLNNSGIEIEIFGKINGNDNFIFSGLFNIIKGYWEYWEVRMKNGSKWKLLRKFKAVEYRK